MVPSGVNWPLVAGGKPGADLAGEGEMERRKPEAGHLRLGPRGVLTSHSLQGRGAKINTEAFVKEREVGPARRLAQGRGALMSGT